MLDWPAFGAALWRVNDELGIRPEWQLPVLHLESAFNPAALNPYGCAGISQFCPGTYERYVSVPVAQYLTWPASAQLAGPIFAYWRDALQRGSIQSAARLMLAQLGYERLRSVPELDNVVFQAPSTAYERNKGLDVTDKGRITERDLAEVMDQQSRKPAVIDAVARAYALRSSERPRDTYGDNYPLITPPARRSSVLAPIVGLLVLGAAAVYGIFQLHPTRPTRSPWPRPEPHPDFDYRSRL